MSAEILSDFIDWYVAMLRSAAPLRLRHWIAALRRGVLVLASPNGAADDAVIIATKRGRERTLGRLGTLIGRGAVPSRQHATIRLPGHAGIILEREAVLPLAVERNLGTALVHEMDRLTPFDADDVLWHAEILRRDRDAGVLRLRLSIVPRRRIAALLDRLAHTSLSVTALEGDVNGAARRIPLGTGAQRRGRSTRALAVLCAILALIALAIPPLRQQIALGHIDAKMEALAPALHRAERLRSRLASDTAGHAALAKQERDQGGALRALAAITGALPDGSFLTDLTLHHDVATLDGESPNAAKLIAGFANSSDFADPQFAAPVTRALNQKADVFVIRVRLRSGAAHGHDRVGARG